MRQDKLTTQFQQALQDAQSLALGRDHQYIEPVHLMSALLEQQGSTVLGLLTKAGVNMNLLRSQLGEALDRVPSVEGTPGEVHISNDLAKLLNVADKLAQERGSAYIGTELFLLAAVQSKTDLGRILEKAGAVKGAIAKAIEEIGGGKADDQNAEEKRQALEKYTDRSHRARGAAEARPRDRSRRRDPAHDPSAPAAHEEQPGADRRAGRRQDRDRRRPRAADRERASPGGAQGQARARRSTWAR